MKTEVSFSSLLFKASSSRRRTVLSGSAAALLATVLCHPGFAATYSWDGADTATSGAQGGAGTWDTNSTANWWNGAADVVWPLSSSGSDVAVFAGNPGTVTISGGVAANQLVFNTTGYSLTGGTLTLDGASPTVTVATGAASTIGSLIAGTGGLYKSGAGTLYLTGTASTYTGVTTVAGGILNVAKLANGGVNSSLGAASNAAANLVIDGGTLQYTGAAAQSSDRLATVGLGGATFESSGGGAVTLSSTGSIGYNGAGSRTITFGGTYTGGVNQFGGMISNSGGPTSIVKTGPGTWLLGVSNGSSNTYTGSTTILSGTLIGGAANGLQGFGSTSTIYLGDTSGSNSAGVQFGTGVATAFNSIPIVIQSGNSGTANVLEYTNASVNSSVTLGSPNSAGKSVTITNIGNYQWTPTFTGVIQDPAGLTGSPGTVIFNNACTGGGTSATFYINGANTYTGDTRLLFGAVTVGNANALQYSTLDLGYSGDVGSVVWNQDSTLGGLKGSRNIDTSGKTLSIGNNNQTTAYSGILSGSGALTKIGTGTLTLSGSESYTGATKINAGTLKIDAGAGGALPASSPLTMNGGTFNHDNTTALGAKNPGLGALTLSLGENNLILTRTALQPVALTFSSLAARPVGVIGNFAYGGTPGTLGTDSVINLTGAAAGFMSQGFFYNGGSASADFAWMNGAGTYVRGINYGTDSNSESINASTAAFTPGQLYEKIGGAGAITSQTTQTITSLAISNANDLTLAGGATLTVNGILKSGNAAGGSITGGAGIQAASGSELVVRTDQAGDTLTIATPILANGASSLTKSGAGTLTLSGSLLYSGTTYVDAGTLSISGTNLYSGPTAIRAGGTLALSSSGNLTLSGAIGGAGTLAMMGSGTLTLGAVSTLTGTVSVSAGTVKLPSMTVGFSSFINGGTLDVTNALWGNNTVTFGINGGTLQAGGANFYAPSTATMSIVTTAGAPTAQFLGTQMLNLNGSTVNFITSSDLNLTDPIRSGGTVNKSGTGTLIVSGAAANEAYSLFLNAGTVRANNANALGSSSATGAITFVGGRLQYNVASPTDWSSRIKNSTGAISVDTNGQNIAWSGTLDSTNTGGLVKSGSGSLTLSAPNSFSGGVTVNSGTLVAGNASALGSTTGALSINGGVLNLGGYSITVGALSGSSGTTITTGTAAGTATLTTSIGSGASIYAGVIADNGSGLVALVKNGAGTLTLSGSNSYSGGTVINAGVLAVSSSTALPGWSTAGRLTVNGGAVLSVGNAFSDGDITTLLTTGSNIRAGAAIGFDTSAGDRTFAASLADTAQGSLGMVKTGGNSLTLSASNSFTGGLTLTSGSLAVSGAGTLGATSGSLTITGAVLDLGATSQMVGAVALSGGVIQNGSLSAGSYAIQSGTVSAALAGSGTLSMSGALLLTGANTYTGATTIASGTLTIGGAGDLGGGSYSGILSNAGALIFNSSAAQTLSGIISGIGPVTQSGSGTLTFSGNNNYTGGLTVSSGSLAIGGVGKLGAASGALAVNGGVLDLGSTSQTAGAVTIGGGVIQSGTLTGSSYSVTGGAVSATLAGNASLTKSGTATLTLSGPNTYSGTNTISAGTLAISGAGKLGAASSPLTVNGGVLDLGSTSQTAGAVTIGGGVIQSGTLTGSSYSATSGAVSASLAGSGALTKTGAGTLTLSGPNSYSGATTVSGGVLTLANLSGTNTIGAVTVAGGTAGASLNVNGATGLGSNNITVGNASGDRSVATLSANIGLNSLDIGNGAGSAGAAYITSGSVNIAAANSYFAQNGYGYFKVSGGTVSGAALWQGANGGSPTGVGVFTISGGLFTSGAAQPFVLGGLNTSGGNAIGVLNMDGGSLNIGNTLGVGWSTNTGGRGEVNVTSGTLTASQFQFNGNASGVLNLHGGVLNTQSVSTIVYLNSNATGYVNFNGGTLQAAQNGATLINLSTTNARNNAFIYSGGATIDTNGYSVSIPTALNAPTGNGLSAIALTGSGAGYIGEPSVQITGGGGSGATARATIDPVTGTVTGIVITNPGTGYTSTPTVSLVGGGSTTVATLGTVSLAANTGGGLTKIGAGMLTLGGTNNYTGPTVVNSGTLQAGSTSAFGSNPVVTLANVAGAGLDLNGYSNTIASLSGGGSAGGNVTVGSGTLTLGGDNSSTSFGGSILGMAGGVVKTGTGTLTLTGTSYTAPITVNSGALTINLAASGTVAASILNYGRINVLGSGTTTISGNIGGTVFGALNQSGSGVTVLYGNNTYFGPTTINNGALVLSQQYSATYSPVTVNLDNGLLFGANTINIGGLGGSGNVALVNGTNAVALNVSNGYFATTYSGVLSGSGGSLTKSGTYTLTLAGANTYTGSTTVSGGALTFANLTGTNMIGAVTVSGSTAGATLNVNGATSLGSGTSSLTVGSASGDRSVVNLAANVGLNSLNIGNVAGSAGAAYVTSGSITLSAGSVYFAQNGYGYFNLSGGSVNGASLWQGGQNGSASGVGVITISGGLFNSGAAQPFVLGGLNTSGGNAIGVLNMDGGSVNIGNTLGVGWSTNSGGRGEANVTSGTLTASQFQFNGNATGVLNLRGGVLNTQSVSTTVYNNSNATGYVNFNGGTLQAAQNGAALINLSTTNARNNAFIYSGGATIDTNGYSVSIPTALNAPTGNGLSAIALTGSGAGYIGEPYVQITGGGGGGATARATIDPSTGMVTGIVITNPGTGYTSTPTVSLVGGGSLTAATVGTVSLAANTGGGLTKIGAGMLTLNGSNNYTGPTMVNAGTLQAGSTSAFGSNPVVTLANVAGAVLDLNGYSNTIASLSGGGSTGGNVTLGSGTLTLGGDNSSTSFGGTFGGTGGVVKTGLGTLTLTGSNNLNGGLTVNSGVLDLGSKNQAFGAVTIGGGVIQSGTLTGSSYSATSGTVSASLAGSGALTMTGPGLLTLANLTGTNTIGAVTVSGGTAGATLNVNGATSLGSGTSSLTVGSASGDRSVVNVAGNLGMGTLGIGNVAGSAGAAYVTSGSVNIAGTAAYFAQNGYGYFKVSGGTVSGAALWQGGMGGSPTGVGVITVSGGSYTTNATQPFVLGGVNTSGGNPIGVLNVDGGLLNIGQFLTTGFSINPSGRGEVNITSGTLAAAQFQFRGNATGVLNLRGGVFNVQSVSTDVYNNSNATGYVNFNGGTLQATQNNAVLINLVTTNAQNNLFIYSGGATIDTNGNSVSIANALNAPTGNGLSAIALTGSGAGYIGEPYVQITGGGGSGATARATIDPATGTVTGIVITNPGTGYTSAPTVSLVGGGSTTAATLGTASLTANDPSGGLTKIGAGTLTLSATNTYGGPTIVNSGTLVLGNSLALPGSTAVTVNGVLDLHGYNAGVASLSGSGTVNTSSAGAVNLTLGSGGSFSGTVKNSSGALALTLSPAVTATRAAPRSTRERCRWALLSPWERPVMPWRSTAARSISTVIR